MSELDEKFGQLSVHIHTVANRLDVEKQKIQFFLNEIKTLRAEFADIIQQFNQHKESLLGTRDEFQKLKALTATVREEFARNLNILEKEMRKEIEDNVKILPGLVNNIANLQQKMLKYDLDLESVALDSRNAILKTNNIEVVTMLNRKKLEQIHLKLNQPDKG